MSYSEEAAKLGGIVDKKQKQYGNSFHETYKILEILYPSGVSTSQYGDLLAMVRILDKFFRLSKGNQGDESAWDDIAGYGILMASQIRGE